MVRRRPRTLPGAQERSKNETAGKRADYGDLERGGWLAFEAAVAVTVRARLLGFSLDNGRCEFVNRAAYGDFFPQINLSWPGTSRNELEVLGTIVT